MRRTEEQLQVAIVDYMLACWPQPPAGPLWTAINPLPGRTTPAQGERRRRMGLRAGWPDLLLIWRGEVIGVELKAPRGVLSMVQREVAAGFNLAGQRWRAVRSLDEFLVLAEQLGIPSRERRVA